MGIKRHGSTPKQWSYARNKVGGVANTKEELAKLAGYSPYVARSVGSKIEKSQGYKNALTELSLQSNSILLKVLAEFERRDLEEFSNKDIISAVNAITSAWAKIDTQTQERLNKNKDPDKNPLRSLFVNRSNVITIEAKEPKDADEIDEEKEINIQRMKDLQQLDL